MKPLVTDGAVGEKWRVVQALAWATGWVGVFAFKIEAQVGGEGDRI